MDRPPVSPSRFDGRMRVYLAARYSRRLELCEYRTQLEGLGVQVTSRWLDGMHQIDAHGNPIGDHGERLVESGGDARSAELRSRFALEDFTDVMISDLLIAFTEEPRVPSQNRGGRHVEMGIALGAAKRVWVVGHRENIFCWFEDVCFFERWETALARLALEVRNTWRKCRKKPVEVEFRDATPGEEVHTREGVLRAQPGDYIIRGVNGEVYPIGREIFEKTYDVFGEGVDHGH